MVTVIKKGSPDRIIKRQIEQSSHKKVRKEIDLKKYCGVINLPEDPLLIQKKWRDEW